MRRREGGFGPALFGSLVLHAAVIAAMLVSLPKVRKDMTIGAVPVTIVSSLPQAAPSPAPEIAEPAAEDAAPPPPAPEPEPQPAPPPPEPEPSPPPPLKKAPALRPTPPPKKAETAPPPKKADTPPQKTPPAKTPPQKTPARQDDALDLSALQQSLARGRPATKATSTRVTPAAGSAQQGQLSAAGASALSALVGRIQDGWILNCEVAGDVEVTVGFTISSGGRLGAGPTLVNRRSGATWDAAARAAQAAVRGGEPYENLPRDLYNQPIEATFKAAEACRDR